MLKNKPPTDCFTLNALLEEFQAMGFPMQVVKYHARIPEECVWNPGDCERLLNELVRQKNLLDEVFYNLKFYALIQDIGVMGKIQPVRNKRKKLWPRNAPTKAPKNTSKKEIKA